MINKLLENQCNNDGLERCNPNACELYNSCPIYNHTNRGQYPNLVELTELEMKALPNKFGTQEGWGSLTI